MGYISPSQVIFDATHSGGQAIQQDIIVDIYDPNVYAVGPISLDDPTHHFTLVDFPQEGTATTGEFTVTVSFQPDGNPGQILASLMVSAMVYTEGEPLITVDIQLIGISAAPSIAVPGSFPSFGNIEIGSDPGYQFLGISNAGNADLILTSVGISGMNPTDFFITAPIPPQVTIQPNSIYPLQLGFKPSLPPGVKQATLTIQSNDPTIGDGIALNLQGTAFTLPHIVVDPASITLGPVQIQSSISQSVTVTNKGFANLQLNQISLSQDAAEEFSLIDVPEPATVIVPGGFITFSVVYSPLGPLERSAILIINSNDTKTPSLTVDITGKVLAPKMKVDPTSLTFDEQIVRSESAAQTVTVTNTGNDVLSIGSMEIFDSTIGLVQRGHPQTSLNYSLPGNLDHCSNQYFNPGASGTFGVNFRPDSTGSKPATVTIPSQYETATMSLSGTGVLPVITVSPNPVDFGNVVVVGQSVSQTITVTNSGNGTLRIGQINLSATTEEFSIPPDRDHCSNQSLGSGTSASFDLEFTPGSAGYMTINVEIPSNDPNITEPLQVQISGWGQISGNIAVTPTTFDFGPVNLGKSSEPNVFNVLNNSSGVLVVDPLFLTGSNAGEFAVQNNHVSGQPISPNGTATFELVFTPGSIGNKTADIHIPPHSPPSLPAALVNVRGSGGMAGIQVQPLSGTFGNVPLGTSSIPVTFRVINTGTAPLKMGALSITGNQAGNFRLQDDHVSNLSIPVSESATFSVVLAPMNPGSLQAQVNIPSDAPGISVFTIPLSGVGGGPLIQVAPGAQSFGDVLLGTTSFTQTFTVINSGFAPLRINTITIEDSGASEFLKVNDPCSGTTLQPGSQSFVQVNFTPHSVGTKGAQLVIPSNDTRNPAVRIPLSGNGITPATISVSPTFNSFGNVRVGSSSSSFPFTVFNINTQPLDIEVLSITGPNASEFHLQDDLCSNQSIPHGLYRTFSVIFSPGSLGDKAAVVNIPSNDPHTRVMTVSISGSGAVQRIFITPASQDFGETAVDSVSTFQTLTVRNTGNFPLQLGNLSLTGADPRDFLLRLDSVSGQTLAPSQAGTVQVAFIPHASGARQAELNIPSNDPQTPVVSIPLTGFGSSPKISFSPSSTDFGPMRLGSSSVPQTFTIANSSSFDLVAGRASITGPGASEFSINSDNFSGTILPPRSVRTIQVLFPPKSGGILEAVLHLPSNDPVQPDAVIPLTGFGVEEARMAVTPSFQNYVPADAAAPVSTQTFVISNTSPAALRIESTEIVGPDRTDFAFRSAPLAAAVIAPEAALPVTVAFVPRSKGEKKAALRIREVNPVLDVFDIPLQGISFVEPEAMVSPSSFNFGKIHRCQYSDPFTFTITNLSDHSLDIGAITLYARDQESFHIANNEASGATLPPHGSATFEVIFRPLAICYKTAVVRIPTSSLVDPVLNVLLSGKGI